MKPGYKQTEVGVIPEEWEVFQLSDQFRIYAGGDVPKHSISEIRSENHPYPIFANALQDQGLYGFTGERRANADSLTITARGYLGHAEYRDEAFFPIVRLLVLEPSGALDARFTTFAVNERVKFAFESTGVPQLTAPQVGKYSIAAPPLPEQRAIAAALSDVDALLGGLERLIAKKRDLKHAAMQQLLSGQTRLPGFSGEWEKTNFAKVVYHHAGNSTLIKGKLAQSSAVGLFPGFSASGQDVWCDRYEFEGDAIIVSAVGSRCGKAFEATGKWCAIANTHVVWPNQNKIDRRFLGFYINDENFWLKGGSGQPFVLFKSTFARSLRLPTKAEQTAIASVLTDMDAELAALEQRRAKTHALKQAMMQELLTGKTRLL